MSDLYGADAYSPVEIARRIESVGEAKARLGVWPLALLGVLAGAFIGLGAMLFVLVKSDPSLGFATSALLGGLVFSTGLFMVVVAGAELFTGNNLIVMAWADGRIGALQVLRNWVVVCLANGVGAVGLALLVFASGHTDLNGGAVGQQVVKMALAKQDLSFGTALLRGILCNILVCMAVWMAMAGRSVVDKAVAVMLPVMAFVAAGFEHSIANMYLMPLAMLVQHEASAATALPLVTWSGVLGNWVVVILGNLLGGAVLVAGVYHVIYRRQPPA
jgi:formate transporter